MNSPNPSPRNPKISKRLVILIVVVAILIGAVGWYVNHSKQKPSGTNQAAASWTEFSSPKYGFKFSYLKSWGTPSLHVESQEPLPGESSPTSIYLVSFSDPGGSQKQSTLSISFSSDTSVQNSCPTTDKNCPGTTFLSGALIKNILTHDKKRFVKYTDTSFSTLASTPNRSQVLSIVQIVNLSKLNVSAATLNYTLSDAAQSCPKSLLAQNTQTQCITQNDYNNFSQALGSLSSL